MKYKYNVIILFIYIAFTVLFNYSLLAGHDLMKWDIIDAYYPLCMSTADMLRNGCLPLWNAAFLFGCPTYIMMGIPFWYPTTLFFELTTGYALICVGIEYCIHIVIACFGCFLLIKSHLEEKEDIKSYVIAGEIGAFYGFSGLFISNAQHIMIIISAAWLPWILLFVKKALETEKMVFLMAAALCMSFSIMGGYPEIWVASFIVLIPYFVIHTIKENVAYRKIIKSVGTYIIFGLETAAASAITLLPFLLSSQYISRLKKGTVVNSYSIRMFLSTILPHYSYYIEIFGEKLNVSMISMYIGLIILILIGWIFALKLKNKWSYLGICLFAFLMMLGNNSFLHPLFYKYFPLFKSLRFPSLWRCILTLFLLLLIAEAFEKILDDKMQIKKLVIVCVVGVVIFLAAGVTVPVYLKNYAVDIQKDFRKDFICDAMILMIYGVFFAAIYFGKEERKKGRICFLGIAIAADILICQGSLYGLTAVCSGLWSNEGIEYARRMYVADAERTHSIDYSEASRTRSGLYSIGIIMDHTLDEEGYLSIQLDYVKKYRKSEHCAISSEVPEVYITADVVSEKEVNFEDWLQDGKVSPYQIYVEGGQTENTQLASRSEIDINHFISGDIELSVLQKTGGYLVVQQSYYPGWKVYVDGEERKIVKINNTFLGVYLEQGIHNVHFLFKPIDFYVGAGITLSFLILFIIKIIVYVRKSGGSLENAER